MNRRRLLVIAALAVIVVIAVSVAVLFLLSPKELQCGYTEIEGFLELRAYPKISDSVPTVMVYVVVPTHEQLQIYLTEDGMPISSLEGFGENDLVIIEGVVYGRRVFGGIGSYWMLEVFAISEED
ncbi:MAG: hypothetical protein OEZ29_05235 [Candidatus Bathyarchaeota archaeon]|nr:hypothetical protein [Candidatus Bathyarchaeota archaeon]